MRISAGLLVLTVLAGCELGIDPVPPISATIGKPVQIAPVGPVFPEAFLNLRGTSNDELDVVRHEGAVYLALRTAPTSAASAEARLFVLRSTDEQVWELETMLQLGRDLRAPRLLSFDGTLLLYFAILGTDPTKREPQQMQVIERRRPGEWTAPADFFSPGRPFVPSRIVQQRGRIYMTAYEHGEHLDDLSGKPIDLYFIESQDGRSWAPVDPARPIVLSGGGSDAGFTFDSRGDLHAVVLNERGDDDGWGSKICHAYRTQLGRWDCVAHRKRYDAPLLFALPPLTVEGPSRLVLIGRRNLTDTGDYMLQPDGTRWSADATVLNATDYGNNRKRCAVWQLDQRRREVDLLADLSSRGDTCRASVVRDGDDAARAVLYYHSSPMRGPDEPWSTALLGPTSIFRAELRLE